MIFKHNQPSHKATAWRRKILFFAFLFVIAGIFLPVSTGKAEIQIPQTYQGTSTGVGASGIAGNPATNVTPSPVAPACLVGTGPLQPGQSYYSGSCDPDREWCCLQSGDAWNVPTGDRGRGYNRCITEESITLVGELKYGAGDFLWAIVNGIARLIIWGAWLIAGYSAYLLDYVLYTLLSSPITTDLKFTPAWTAVRDLANMLIVLGFIIVGIATALRIKEYAAGQLLWKLIVVALFVNFSGLFCGIVIDASNITTTGIFSQGQGQGQHTKSISIAEGMLFTIEGPVKGHEPSAPGGAINPAATADAGPLSWYNAKNFPEKFAGNCVIFAAVFLGMAFTFLYLAVILIARYVILIMLFILSPLAFAFWAFPLAKSKFTEWWNAFLKWAFVGVFSAFVLWLSTIMIKNIDNSSLSLTVITCVIVLGFLYVGFKMTAKSTGLASMATGAIMGLAGGAAGLAMGATGKIAGGLANKTGASRVGNWVKNKTGGALERVGLRQAGTTAGNAAAEIDKRQKSIASLGQDQQAKIANARPISHDATQNKVAAIKNLAKSGDLNKLGGTDAQAKALSYVESYEKSRGVSSGDLRKDAEAHNYKLAAQNKGKVDKALVAQGITNPATATATQRTAAEERVTLAQLRENLPKMSASEAGNIDYDHIFNNYDMVKEEFTPAIINKLRTAPTGPMSAGSGLRSHLGNTANPAGAMPDTLARDYHEAVTSGDKGEASRLKKQIEAIQRLP